jgi:multidrug resistance efflux pump
MTAFVKILSPSDYKTKLAQLSAEINQANDQVTQLRQILTASGNLGG